MGARKKRTWGGPRKGAGRKLTGRAIRRNRLTILLTDREIEQLRRLADQQDLPTGTLAYEIVRRALARRR